jgi:hypothetical protein
MIATPMSKPRLLTDIRLASGGAASCSNKFVLISRFLVLVISHTGLKMRLFVIEIGEHDACILAVFMVPLLR